MPTVKENLAADIVSCREAALRDKSIARKLFLCDSPYAFLNDRIKGFKILDAIALKFSVPISAVKIAGSAQLGFSFVKNREFVPGESDLDIAIVSAPLFQKYCEIVYEETLHYTDYQRYKDTESRDLFQQNLHLGYFRPDLMPRGMNRTDWFQFFNGLSAEHSLLFKNINAGIYFSEAFFTGKQLAAVEALGRGVL